MRRPAIRTIQTFPARGGVARRRRRARPSDIQQIGTQGGFTALHYAVRDGYADAADAAARRRHGREQALRRRPISTPLVVATLNGQYDIAMTLLKRGADPNLPSDDGVAPLFAMINNEWALRTWYPQPTAGAQQKASYLDAARGAAQGRRRSERAHALAHLVRVVQHRTHGRGLRGRDAVLARRLLARRRRDAPARQVRRRPVDSRRCRSARRSGRTIPQASPACPPAVRTCRRSTRRAASATARRASRSSIATCPMAGCPRRSTSSRS